MLLQGISSFGPYMGHVKILVRVISQSSHPVGLTIKSKWCSVRLANALVLSVLLWVTFVITTSLSSSLLEESNKEEQVVEVLLASAGVTFLHGGYFQVVL